MKPPFSINTDVFDVNTEIEPRLRLFANAGFRFVHWCEHAATDHKYSDREMSNTRNLLGRYGLRCLDLHGVYKLDRDGAVSSPKWVDLNVNRMEFIHALGGNIIVLHVPLPLVAGLSQMDMSRKMIDALLPASERLGVKIAVENINNNLALLQSLFDSYPFEKVGFCFDSGHAQVDGNMEILEMFLDRLFLVHLHDNYGKEDDHNLPGQGIIDWGRLMRLVLSAQQLKTITVEVGLLTRQDRFEWLRDAYVRLEEITKA